MDVPPSASLTPVRIGTAGWSIPSWLREEFGPGGSLLSRYATRLSCVEINSTFYRRHQAKTFQRWADATPDDFKFAVKAPKTITHEARLVEVGALMDLFLDDAANLGEKLGPLLFQLPPSLRFEPSVTERFFADLRARHAGGVVLEPRHATWFTPEVETLLTLHGIARAAADPSPAPGADRPAGSPQLGYWRLHGSPVVYVSPYDDNDLHSLSSDLAMARAEERLVIFDNTARGAATEDALRLSMQLGPASETDVDLVRS